MRTTHILRKPASEGNIAANVLKHGTGALNIDRSRITTQDNLNGGAYAEQGAERWDGAENWRHKHEGGAGEFQQPSGRWPANLILQHKPGCRCVGTTRVAATSIHGESTATRRSGVHTEAKGHQTVGRTQPVTGYADADGKETVPAWDCAPGCPVAALDEQSGVSCGVGGASSGLSAFGQNSGWNKHNNRATTIDRHNDKGGASRFYKQVTNMDELTEYLYNLIAPTHLDDCNVLVIEDPANFDWSVHEDASVHGAILVAPGGKDTSYKDEVWRILKPGAHLLVYAPDDEPTGHTGACALEDQGFEVRDAILIVAEPGRLHYVPKPSKKERHSGCQNLKLAVPEGEPAEEDEEEDPDAKDPTLKGNIHPTCKPRDIMVRLMQDVPTGATVLDPFMGSGTTGLACLKTGHDFIGIEMSPEYIQIADARVRYWDSAVVGEGALIDSEAPKNESGREVMDLADLFGL